MLLRSTPWSTCWRNRIKNAMDNFSRKQKEDIVANEDKTSLPRTVQAAPSDRERLIDDLQAAADDLVDVLQFRENVGDLHDWLRLRVCQLREDMHDNESVKAAENGLEAFHELSLIMHHCGYGSRQKAVERYAIARAALADTTNNDGG